MCSKGFVHLLIPRVDFFTITPFLRVSACARVEDEDGIRCTRDLLEPEAGLTPVGGEVRRDWAGRVSAAVKFQGRFNLIDGESSNLSPVGTQHLPAMRLPQFPGRAHWLDSMAWA